MPFSDRDVNAYMVHYGGVEASKALPGHENAVRHNDQRPPLRPSSLRLAYTRPHGSTNGAEWTLGAEAKNKEGDAAGVDRLQRWSSKGSRTDSQDPDRDGSAFFRIPTFRSSIVEGSGRGSAGAGVGGAPIDGSPSSCLTDLACPTPSSQQTPPALRDWRVNSISSKNDEAHFNKDSAQQNGTSSLLSSSPSSVLRLPQQCRAAEGTVTTNEWPSRAGVVPTRNNPVTSSMPTPPSAGVAATTTSHPGSQWWFISANAERHRGHHELPATTDTDTARHHRSASLEKDRFVLPRPRRAQSCGATPSASVDPGQIIAQLRVRLHRLQEENARLQQQSEPSRYDGNAGRDDKNRANEEKRRMKTAVAFGRGSTTTMMTTATKATTTTAARDGEGQRSSRSRERTSTPSRRRQSHEGRQRQPPSSDREAKPLRRKKTRPTRGKYAKSEYSFSSGSSCSSSLSSSSVPSVADEDRQTRRHGHHRHRHHQSNDTAMGSAPPVSSLHSTPSLLQSAGTPAPTSTRPPSPASSPCPLYRPTAASCSPCSCSRQSNHALCEERERLLHEALRETRGQLSAERAERERLCQRLIQLQRACDTLLLQPDMPASVWSEVLTTVVDNGAALDAALDTQDWADEVTSEETEEEAEDEEDWTQDEEMEEEERREVEKAKDREESTAAAAAAPSEHPPHGPRLSCAIGTNTGSQVKAGSVENNDDRVQSHGCCTAVLHSCVCCHCHSHGHFPPCCGGARVVETHSPPTARPTQSNVSATTTAAVLTGAGGIEKERGSFSVHFSTPHSKANLDGPAAASPSPSSSSSTCAWLHAGRQEPPPRQPPQQEESKVTPAEGASVRARSLVGSGTGGALRQDDGAVASEAFNRRRRHLDPSSHTSPARLLEASSSFVLSGSTPSLSPSPMPPAGRSEAASGERVIRIQGGRPFGDVRSEALRQCSPLYDPFRADTLCPSGVLAGGAAPHSSSHSRGSTAGATATSGSSARMISQSPSGEDPTSLPDWRQMPIAKKLLMGESLRAAPPSLAAAAVAPAGDHRIGGAANGTRERDDPFVSHATNGYQAEWLPHGATPNTDIPRILVHTPLAHHTTAKVHPVQQQQRSTTPVSYLASGKNSIQAAHGREERHEEMEVQGMEAMDMQGNRCANVDFGLSPKLIEEEDTPWHQHPGVGLETVLSDSGMR